MRAFLGIGWQPIETAPRDGTWVLLCGGTTDEDDYLKEVGQKSLSRPVVAHWIPSSWDDGWWAVSYWDGAWRTNYKNPTHWRPIPKAPKP